MPCLGAGKAKQPLHRERAYQETCMLHFVQSKHRYKDVWRNGKGIDQVARSGAPPPSLLWRRWRRYATRSVYATSGALGRSLWFAVTRDGVWIKKSDKQAWTLPMTRQPCRSLHIPSPSLPPSRLQVTKPGDGSVGGGRTLGRVGPGDSHVVGIGDRQIACYLHRLDPIWRAATMTTAPCVGSTISNSSVGRNGII